MKIAFASGKGGTGKTTVAVNFAYFLAFSLQQVQYLDCDVEEPNGHIFLKPEIYEKYAAKVMTPVIDQDKCTSCGECSAKCQFNALVTLPGNVLVFPELCHGCGLCVRLCPVGAISEGEREIGYIEKGKALNNIEFVSGVLNVGEPMSGPLIQEVKTEYVDNHIQIIDAPPGTSCPVVKTISDVDCVVMVTEPTPFGLHDLKIAVTVAEMLGRPIGVVINRESGGFPPLTDYLLEKGLHVLMTLPESRDISVSYSMGNLILRSLPAYVEKFMELTANIGRLLGRTLWRNVKWN
ncbi:MAG: (4Fe-4S)-binding protein [Syntrophus sp. (in: bacteria)]|nr:(4Fe-4S)-binding protein [Syntrophus sp. (in: bacteria)]